MFARGGQSQFWSGGPYDQVDHYRVFRAVWPDRFSPGPGTRCGVFPLEGSVQGNHRVAIARWWRSLPDHRCPCPKESADG